MTFLFTEIIKYAIAALMILYTIQSFLAFRYRSESLRSGITLRQRIELFGILALMFAQVYLNTGSVHYLFYGVALAMMMIITMLLFKYLFPDGNAGVVNHVCLFLMTGVTVITRVNEAKAMKQMVVAAASIALGLLVTELVFRYDIFKKLTYVYAGAGVALLAMVNLLGRTTYGARMTFTIAGVSFMPSEIVKVIFVFFLACALSKASGIVQVLVTGVFAAAHVVILVLSRDLGSALIYSVVYVIMIFVASGQAAYLLAGAAAGAAAAYVAYMRFAHVRVRVQTFRDPWRTIDTGGYQITQSLFGVSAGGLFGFGLFKGMPASVPFVEEDLIFSAIAEELGIIFAFCLLMVCLATFLTFLYEAYRLRDPFYRLLAVGLGSAYIFQVFLTVGGSVKFIPLTGVTLPFVSYGGTSMLTSVMMFCIFEGISRVRTFEHKEALKRLHAMKGIRESERNDVLEEGN